MHSKLPKSAADERQAKNNLAKFSQSRRKPSSPVGCANGCHKAHKKSLFSISLRNCFSFTLWLAPATIHQLVKRRNWDRDIKTAVAWLTMVVPSGLPRSPLSKATPTVTGAGTGRMMSCDDIITWLCTPHLCPYSWLYLYPHPPCHTPFYDPHRSTLYSLLCCGLEIISAATSIRLPLSSSSSASIRN